MMSLTEDEIKSYIPSLEAVFYAAGSVRYFAEPFIKNGITDLKVLSGVYARPL